MPKEIILKNTKEKSTKNYVLCESEFLSNIITSFPKSKSREKIDYFCSTRDEGRHSYIYVEKETFNKLDICEKILFAMSKEQLLYFLYGSVKNSNIFYSYTNLVKTYALQQAFIKLYTLPPDQLETRINQYRLERL